VSYTPPYRNLEDRLLSNSILWEDHWIWVRYICRSGYGRISLILEGKERPSALAHRISYAYFKGTIPPGYDVDHRCGVRCCINPAHLRLVFWKKHRVDALTRNTNPGAKLSL
jgi:hypothetical protein